MVLNYFICSACDNVGKSVLSIAMLLKARELGKRAGYFKPVGSLYPFDEAPMDQDVAAIRALLQEDFTTQDLCPITLGAREFLHAFKADKSHEYREAVTNSFKKISSGKEVMVIEGANSLGAASFINLQPPALAESLRAKVIMVVKPSDDNVVDEITMAGEYFSRWGVGLYGVVFNLASEQAERRVNDLMAPYLTRLSIKNLGVILENREMKAPTVGEVQEALHGKILAGDEGLGNRIGEVFVGAMSIENAIKYFRKSVNKIVVIGGDRTDIALAAMETGASAIVFTGGIHPSMKLMPRADEAKTPLILVPYDTYTTLQLINQVVSKLQPTNERWIGLLKETFWKRMRWDEIFRG